MACDGRKILPGYFLVLKLSHTMRGGASYERRLHRW